MTLAELGERMSAAEFQIWIAEQELRSHECPHCGLEPRDMSSGVSLTKIKCPFCKTEYDKVVTPRGGVVHDMTTQRLSEE